MKIISRKYSNVNVNLQGSYKRSSFGSKFDLQGQIQISCYTGRLFHLLSLHSISYLVISWLRKSILCYSVNCEGNGCIKAWVVFSTAAHKQTSTARII